MVYSVYNKCIRLWLWIVIYFCVGEKALIFGFRFQIVWIRRVCISYVTEVTVVTVPDEQTEDGRHAFNFKINKLTFAGTCRWTCGQFELLLHRSFTWPFCNRCSRFRELSSFVPELRETRQQRPKMLLRRRMRQPKVSRPLRDMKALGARVNKATISKEAASVQSMSSHKKEQVDEIKLGRHSQRFSGRASYPWRSFSAADFLRSRLEMSWYEFQYHLYTVQ